MMSRNVFSLFVLSACIVVFTVFASVSFAQSSQYKRASKKAAVPTTETPTKNAGGKASSTAETSAPAKQDDKVNIQEIEQQYWTPKDTEFKVVQNRRYTKEKRFYGTGSVGFLIGDENSVGQTYNLGLGYYFKEQYGVELMYTKYDTESNKANILLKDRGGFFNQNKPQQYAGAAFHWVPIYAKMSLLDWEIIYFDMAISPSLGVSWSEQLSQAGNNDVGPYFTMGIDVSQHFFISEHFAFKFDYRNRFYNEQVIRYYAGVGAANPPFSQSKNISTVTFGVEYFY